MVPRRKRNVEDKEFYLLRKILIILVMKILQKTEKPSKYFPNGPKFVFRSRLVLSLPIAFLLVACGASKTSQIDGESWTWKNIDGTVMEKSNNVREAAAIGSPDVIKAKLPNTETGFVMAYAQGGSDSKGRIGLAWSADGQSWKKYAGNNTYSTQDSSSILEPSSSGWDSHFLDTPCILKVGEQWYLYYFGAPSNDIPGGAIGLALSSDGLNWEKYSGNPVLSGSSGTWDSLWVESPSVRYVDGVFHMIYTGVDETWRPLTGHATSSDGINWVKDSLNPVLTQNTSANWDDYGAAVGTVIYRNGTWVQFYCSTSQAEVFLGLNSPSIGLATSKDASTWDRYEDNPLLNPWDIGLLPNGPWAPGAFYDEASNEWYLWYENGYGFGLALGSPEL